MDNLDTIAAVATPPGKGGVGIIRISGPQTSTIAKTILNNLPQPRFAHYGPFFDEQGETLDKGIALYFPGPNSFTGEDVLELHGHGGPVILDILLQRVISSGARIARPGEFSERAFLNDKIDLAQAEAIADLIDSSSTKAAKMAMRSLQGEFSNRVNTLLEKLIYVRMYVESAIDFPEEEIDFLSDGVVATKIAELLESTQAVIDAAQQGSVMREGMRVVLTGQPNAGKSTLLNCLAGWEAAIVTDIAGTTRDVLHEQITIDGMPLHIIDTAGLRESQDKIEQEGIRRAWQEIEKSDRILLLVNDSEGVTKVDEALLAKLPTDIPVTIVRNKVDLSSSVEAIKITAGRTEVSLSAKMGKGIELLTEHLKQTMGLENISEGGFIARRRHVDSLLRAQQAIINGKQQLELAAAGELLAEELRVAQQALSEITGKFSSDDLLGEIFSSFCIGK